MWGGGETMKMYEDKGQNLGEMGREILDDGLDVKCSPTPAPGSCVWTLSPQLMLQFGRLWNLVGRRLAGESESLGTSIIILALPFLCSLSASQMWMQRDKLPPTPSPPTPSLSRRTLLSKRVTKQSFCPLHCFCEVFHLNNQRTTTGVLKYKWEP